LDDPNIGKRVTIVGIRKVFGSVLRPDLGVFSSVGYIGRSIQAERLHLTRTASDGSTTLLFAAPCQYWTGLLPERRVEGLGPLEQALDAPACSRVLKY
jgi:hypothetical protein